MTDLETEPAGSGAGVRCQGNRVILERALTTSVELEQLRTAVEHVLKQLRDVDEPELVIDVAQGGYLTTATLTMLLGLARRCQDAGKQLALEGASADTLHALDVTRIAEILASRGARISRPSA